MTDYSRGDYADLPAGTTDLENNYSAPDLTAIASNDNSTYADQTANNEIAIHQYKKTVTGQYTNITWSGKSSLAPSESPVIMEVYNVTGTPAWEELDRDDSTAADTDFDIIYNNLATADYLDSGVITWRVYQSASGLPSGAIILFDPPTPASFDGSSDSVTVDAGLITGMSGVFSIAAWFSASAYQTNDGAPDWGGRVLIDTRDGTYTELHGLYLHGSLGRFASMFNWSGTIDAGNRAFIESGSSPGLDTPAIFVCTYDQENFRMYVNGTEDAASPAAKTFAAYTPTTIKIGKFADTSLGGYFAGTISRVVWWNRALGSVEVASLT